MDSSLASELSERLHLAARFARQTRPPGLLARRRPGERPTKASERLCLRLIDAARGLAARNNNYLALAPLTPLAGASISAGQADGANSQPAGHSGSLRPPLLLLAAAAAGSGRAAVSHLGARKSAGRR